MDETEQEHGEMPLLVQMQSAIDRLDAFITNEAKLGDVPVMRKQSCLLKDHVVPRPDLGSVKFTLKNRFSHLASFRKKKIIENIDDLKEKSVAIIGLSGVGGLVAEMLTRTGIGKLTLIDHGAFSVSTILPTNGWFLGRVKMASMSRMHFLPEQVGMTKVQASRIYLRHLNPHVEIETYHCDVTNELDADILLDVLQDCKMQQQTPQNNQMTFRLPMDAIVCCVDNSQARKRVNQIALQLSIPLIDVRLSPCSSFISVQTILPGITACLQCHWNDKYEGEATTADAVSKQCPATLPQSELIAAGLVSQSALKLLLEFGEQVPFYRLDCLQMDMSTFWFKPSSECCEPMCRLKQDEFKIDASRHTHHDEPPKDETAQATAQPDQESDEGDSYD
ncbi:hypothetical protein AeNC1_004723 [Aphanomyces euteiches]|nr:hypothetical protein AeNC1_004723 [Aphanomyces euteiches]